MLRPSLTLRTVSSPFRRPVEVDVALQGGDVVVGLEVGAVVLIDFGIEGVADGLLLHLEVGEAFHIELLPQVLLDLLKVHVRQQGAGADGDGLDVLQDDLLQFLGEAALGWPIMPLKKSMTESG